MTAEDSKKCLVLCSAMNIFLGLSVGMSVYNKWILGLHKFPLFLLTNQFLFLFIASGALIHSLLRAKLSQSPFWISRISFSFYHKKLLPIGLLYGSDYILTNIAIANGPLAFVQMIKSGVPLVVLFLKLFEPDSQPISPPIIFSMVLLCSGQFLIFVHEVEFDWICFIASMCALISSGSKLFVVEKLLKHKKSTPLSPRRGSSLDMNGYHSSRSQHSYNQDDIQNEGEHRSFMEDDVDGVSQTFIGMDSFAPAELELTDDEESKDGHTTYYYDVAMDGDGDREEVELQYEETNKRHSVQLVRSPTTKEVNGDGDGDGVNDGKKDLFRSILEKLSVDNIRDSEDENAEIQDPGIQHIESEKRKVSEYLSDIPLNDRQKWTLRANAAISSIPKLKKQKMHSMLALFYFMPPAWIIAVTAFLVCASLIFEYPVIKRDAVFSSTSELSSLMLQYVLSAVIAIALNWCELFMIGRWNSLSFCIFGVFKLICTVGASWLFFGHSFTFYSFCGYLLCIGGVLSYNWSQIKNKRKVKKDLNAIGKAFLKICHWDKCCRRNKRRLYTKLWSEFPESSVYDDEVSDSTSESYEY